MISKIDAIGKPCPFPVILAKNALKNILEGIVEITVDNEISCQNVEKLCKESKFKYEILKKENDIFIIIITKTGKELMEIEERREENIVVVIPSDEMGGGDTILGKTLLKGFIYTLTELEIMPKTIIFYNKGILLTVKNSDSFEDIKKLEEAGVEILICGACVNFYDVLEEIKVGKITNMYEILKKQMNSTKVISS